MSTIVCRDVKSIENYDKAKADNFKGWVIHHRAETHFSDGIPRPPQARISRDELIGLGLYYNRPAEELIYLTRAEHNTLHHKDKIQSEESREKMSKTHKERLTDEVRKNISEGTKRGMTPEVIERVRQASLGRKHSEESKSKIASSIKAKNWHWYTNGTINVKSDTCPEGFKPGRKVDWFYKKQEG